jgi:predicted dehydrogenase
MKRGLQCGGIWDHDEERGRRFAEKLGGKTATVVELVEDRSINAFVVCSETVHHLDLVGHLAEAGKPTFIEKPMGFDAAQSKAIQSLLDDHGIVFQTGYFSRGLPTFRTLKQKVDQGFFGTITRVRASCCHSGALGGWFDTDYRWMADRSQAGVGAFGDLGTHVLDLLIWIFGDVEAATGLLSNGTNRYGCDELGEALLKFSNGAIGTLAASWNDVADPVRIQVAGTKGHALLGSDLQLAGPDGKFAPIELLEKQPAGFDAFLDFLEGKSVELVAAKEATRRDVTMDAIYRGARESSWVKIHHG